MKSRKSKFGVMICMPRPSDKRVVDETSEYIRQETKISWIGLAKAGVYAEAPEYARIAMAAEALEGDITHIYMLDADTVPPPDTILRLIQHDRDIIAGVYPLFVNGIKSWSFSTEENLHPYVKLPRKPFKVKKFGGSTVLIKRQVFEKLSRPWFKTVMEGNTIKMGHDFYFCHKAREAGFQLWVDPTIKCDHYNVVELNRVFNAGQDKNNA